MWRLRTYAGLSLASILVTIYYAFHSKTQFYPAMIYLSTSKISVALLLNMGLVFMCILWKLTSKLFLGSLREAEIERLNEQSWREVIEILFAITIFKQDFSVLFLAMVTALLLIKGLHWLALKRVEYIETIQMVTVVSHIRIASFLGFLLLVDGVFLYKFLRLLQTQQASVALFFSFEYMILAMTTMMTLIKYAFFVMDVVMEGQWERKSVYTFYLDLIHDLLHLSNYLCFFTLIFINYGVALHMIRELYETFLNFKLRIADYIRYRKITSHLNECFPDATPEDLRTSDATCIICREVMTAAKKLTCNHLFHLHCLRSWMERQHTCPTCRALVWPYESSTRTTDTPLMSQTDIHQQASASTSHGSTGSSDDVVDDNSGYYHHTRINQDGVAATVYVMPLVYPYSATMLVWNPECAVLANCSMMYSENCDFRMTPNQLEAMIMFYEHQIEILQNQLRCLQTSEEDEMTHSTDTKGKAIVIHSDNP